jgi:hypothetical protein
VLQLAAKDQPVRLRYAGALEGEIGEGRLGGIARALRQTQRPQFQIACVLQPAAPATLRVSGAWPRDRALPSTPLLHMAPQLMV